MKSSTWRGLLTTGVLLLILTLILPRFEVLQIRFFCAPAAFLTSIFLGAPLRVIETGYAIHMSKPIEVTTACSAINFFSLTLAVFAGLAVGSRWSFRSLLCLLPAAYLLTLLANTSRIVSTWYTDTLAALWFPDSLHKGIHALAGAVIFMTALSFGYYILWRLFNEHENEETAA